MKAVKPKFDFLRFEEAPKVFAATDEQWRPMALLALKTGLRIGEQMALRWEDVDLKGMQFTVRQSLWRGHVTAPKSNRIRTVDLTDEATAALSRSRHRKGPLVFCKEDGDYLMEDICRAPLYRACKAAGLRQVGRHVLRHTFPSHLVMRGVDLKVVQECLGHATMEMTLRYAHLIPKARKHGVNRLDEPIPDWAREESHSTPTALDGRA